MNENQNENINENIEIRKDGKGELSSAASITSKKISQMIDKNANISQNAGVETKSGDKKNETQTSGSHSNLSKSRVQSAAPPIISATQSTKPNDTYKSESERTAGLSKKTQETSSYKPISYGNRTSTYNPESHDISNRQTSTYRPDEYKPSTYKQSATSQSSAHQEQNLRESVSSSYVPSTYKPSETIKPEQRTPESKSADYTPQNYKPTETRQAEQKTPESKSADYTPQNYKPTVTGEPGRISQTPAQTSSAAGATTGVSSAERTASSQEQLKYVQPPKSRLSDDFKPEQYNLSHTHIYDTNVMQKAAVQKDGMPGGKKITYQVNKDINLSNAFVSGLTVGRGEIGVKGENRFKTTLSYAGTHTDTKNTTNTKNLLRNIDKANKNIKTSIAKKNVQINKSALNTGGFATVNTKVSVTPGIKQPDGKHSPIMTGRVYNAAGVNSKITKYTVNNLNQGLRTKAAVNRFNEITRQNKELSAKNIATGNIYSSKGKITPPQMVKTSLSSQALVATALANAKKNRSNGELQTAKVQRYNELLRTNTITVKRGTMASGTRIKTTAQTKTHNSLKGQALLFLNIDSNTKITSGLIAKKSGIKAAEMTGGAMRKSEDSTINALGNAITAPQQVKAKIQTAKNVGIASQNALKIGGNIGKGVIQSAKGAFNIFRAPFVKNVGLRASFAQMWSKGGLFGYKGGLLAPAGPIRWYSPASIINSAVVKAINSVFIPLIMGLFKIMMVLTILMAPILVIVTLFSGFMSLFNPITGDVEDWDVKQYLMQPEVLPAIYNKRMDKLWEEIKVAQADTSVHEVRIIMNNNPTILSSLSPGFEDDVRGSITTDYMGFGVSSANMTEEEIDEYRQRYMDELVEIIVAVFNVKAISDFDLELSGGIPPEDWQPQAGEGAENYQESEYQAFILAERLVAYLIPDSLPAPWLVIEYCEGVAPPSTKITVFEMVNAMLTDAIYNPAFDMDAARDNWNDYNNPNFIPVDFDTTILWYQNIQDKMEQGYMEEVYDTTGNITFMEWNDENLYYLLSNYSYLSFDMSLLDGAPDDIKALFMDGSVCESEFGHASGGCPNSIHGCGPHRTYVCPCCDTLRAATPKYEIIDGVSTFVGYEDGAVQLENGGWVIMTGCDPDGSNPLAGCWFCQGHNVKIYRVRFPSPYELIYWEFILPWEKMQIQYMTNTNPEEKKILKEHIENQKLWFEILDYYLSVPGAGGLGGTFALSDLQKVELIDPAGYFRPHRQDLALKAATYIDREGRAFPFYNAEQWRPWAGLFINYIYGRQIFAPPDVLLEGEIDAEVIENAEIEGFKYNYKPGSVPDGAYVPAIDFEFAFSCAPGDILSLSYGGAEQIGIVYGVTKDGQYVYVLEGSWGDRVAAKRYKLGDVCINGYYRCDYYAP